MYDKPLFERVLAGELAGWEDDIEILRLLLMGVSYRNIRKIEKVSFNRIVKVKKKAISEWPYLKGRFK